MGAVPVLLDARDRVALITGAAGGIGQAVCAMLRAAGAGVAGVDLTAPANADLAIAADCSLEAKVDDAIRATVDRLGRIDFVVNAAGLAGSGRLDAMSAADWQRVLDANLNSAFLVTRAAYAHLARTKGAVVLFSSTNGRNGGGSLSGAAYAVAKAGIINLARYLAREWAPDAVRVNCIAPGPVATPMLDRFTETERESLRQSMPLKRITTADEIAGCVAFLCSPHAASITGACLNVSGGLVLD